MLGASRIGKVTTLTNHEHTKQLEHNTTITEKHMQISTPQNQSKTKPVLHSGSLPFQDNYRLYNQKQSHTTNNTSPTSSAGPSTNFASKKLRNRSTTLHNLHPGPSRLGGFGFLLLLPFSALRSMINKLLMPMKHPKITPQMPPNVETFFTLPKRC